MKKSKKWISLLLAGALATGFAGCSGGNSVKTDTAGISETGAAEDGQAETQPDGEKTGGSEAKTSYPDKTVKIILPYAAGGDTDLNARLAAKYLTQELGQTVVVSNMTWASGTVASQYVKDAKPDGYEMMFNHNNVLIHKLLGLADYSYDSFAVAATIVSDNATGLVVPADSKYQTLQDLIDDAKANPGKIIYATQAGAFTTLLGLVLEDKAGIDLNIVDAGGAAEQITAMLGGQSDVSAFPYGLVKDQVTAGKMRYLCIFAEEDNPLIAGVPTAKEEGIDLALTRKYSFYMPKDTPQEVIDTFSSALKKVSENPQFIEESNAMFATPDYMDQKETEEYLREMDALYAQYSEALKSAQ